MYESGILDRITSLNFLSAVPSKGERHNHRRQKIHRRGELPLLAALFALPFVFPLVSGPSVSVWQLLTSWLCATFLFARVPPCRPSYLLLAWMVISGVLVLARSALEPAQSHWLGTWVAIAVIGIASYAGAGVASGGKSVQRAMAWGLLLAGLISVLLGLLQYYGLAESLVPWTTEPGVGQAYGNLRQRNQFATFLSLSLIAALWLYVDLGVRGRRFLVGAVCSLVIGLAASNSRTGLLELVVIVGLASFMARQERRPARDSKKQLIFCLPSPFLLLALIPLYFTAASALPMLTDGTGVGNILQRLRDSTPEGYGRSSLWRNVLALIAQHPWAGWGWGELSYAHYITSYQGARYVEILDNAHNLPLHLAVELGIPTAVLICGGFTCMVLLARPWREKGPARLMAWGMLGVILLHSLLEYPLWYGPFQLVFGVCLGMLWPGGRRLIDTSEAGVRAAIAIGVIGLTGYVAWDYVRISQIYLPKNERLSAYRENTLEKLQGSFFFENQIEFAELTLTPVTAANAELTYLRAQRLLHFSPEPRVIVKLIESARLSGREEEAKFHAARFQAAFPKAYTRWIADCPVDACDLNPRDTD